MRNGIARGIALLGLAFVPVTALGDATSLYQNASATSASDLQLDASPTLTVTVRPKKKQMLVVHGTVTSTAASGTLSASVRVNGTTVEPGLVKQACSGDCTLSATWWLDLDAAELASPGTYLNGMPLTVTLHPSANNPNRGNSDIIAILIRRGREMGN